MDRVVKEHEFYIHLSTRDPTLQTDLKRGILHKTLPEEIVLSSEKTWFVSLDFLLIPSNVHNVHERNDEWHYCKMESDNFEKWLEHLLIFHLPHGRYTPEQLAEQFNTSLRAAAQSKGIRVDFKLTYLPTEKRFVARSIDEFIGTPPDMDGAKLLGLGPYNEEEPFFPPPLWNQPNVVVYKRLPFVPHLNTPHRVAVMCNLIYQVQANQLAQPWLSTFPWIENRDVFNWSPSFPHVESKEMQRKYVKEIKLSFVDENSQDIVFPEKSEIFVTLRIAPRPR
jgi:hypothetical protein